jgi:hypothetical protein
LDRHYRTHADSYAEDEKQEASPDAAAFGGGEEKNLLQAQLVGFEFKAVEFTFKGCS